MTEVDCPSCEGRGYHQITTEDAEDCGQCNGYGAVMIQPEENTVTRKPSRDPLKAIERTLADGTVPDAETLATLAAIRRESLSHADRAIAATHAAVRLVAAARATDGDQPNGVELAVIFGVTPQMVSKWHYRPGTSARDLAQ